jgi:hypothetical protein
MKKILALLTAAAFVFAGTTPAKADVTYFEDWQWWSDLTASQAGSLSYSGSLVAGETYRVTASGTTPGTTDCIVIMTNLNGTQLKSETHRGMFSMQSDPLVAGQAGTYQQFGLQIFCSQQANYRNGFMKLTFETPVGQPSNFTVTPQSAGIAFTTWGLAARATSYTVTATPTNSSLNLPVRTCTTAQNSCDVSGLTSGASYTFSLVATNGVASSTAVTAGPVSISPPVTVAAAITSTNWKVGNAVNVVLSLQGSPSPTATITWYRCATPANSTNAQPVTCESISSGAATSYTLAAADAGKYIAAFVSATNGFTSAAQTAASSTAVLAADAVAPAPVADPGGKPTVVNIANPIVSVSGGAEVTITGTGLASVTGVTVGGLPAIVVSKSDKSVVIKVPVSTKTGLADLIITNDKGSVTSSSAIIYANNPVVSVTKTKTITGFTARQKTLTTAQKTAVRALITANPTLTTLSCAARTTGVASNKTELAKAKTLATATCAYAKTLKKTLIVSSTASQTLPKSKASRSVALTLRN